MKSSVVSGVRETAICQGDSERDEVGGGERAYLHHGHQVLSVFL